MTPTRRSAIIVLSFGAAAVAAAVAAGVAHRRNLARAGVYEHDPSCRASLVAPTAGRTPCTAEAATIAARWTSYFKSTPHYHLALRTADGLVDSVELQGFGDRMAFSAVAPLREVLVQRYHERETTHVTLIQSGMSAVRTQWNPGWRGDDAMAGAVLFGLIALALMAWGAAMLRHENEKRPD